MKAEHRMDRNYLKGREGDRINAVLAAAGYNFSLLLRWLERLLRALIVALTQPAAGVRLARTSCTRLTFALNAHRDTQVLHGRLSSSARSAGIQICAEGSKRYWSATLVAVRQSRSSLGITS